MDRFKYLASISYDGSCFFGFTKSSDKITVQSRIEEILKKIYKKYSFNPDIKCASRTDKGVHSINQQITFFLPVNISDNSLLKIFSLWFRDSILFNKVNQVDTGYDLFDNIIDKEYIYIISFAQISPFLSKYAWFKKDNLNIKEFYSIMSLFKGEHDFGEFAKEKKRYESTICNISKIDIINKKEQKLLYTCIKGNRFLYNMIRRMIGCAIFITEKGYDIPDSFESLIEKYKNYGTMRAPSNGLYLLNVNLKN